jgi:PKD repeat protein
MHKKLLLLSFLMGGLLLSWAQNPGPVMFRSGAESFPDNLNRFVESTISPADIVGGRYYRYVQFQATPPDVKRKEMEREGLKFLAYIPHATYLVSIPANYDLKSLLNHPVRSVVRPNSLHKVSPQLVEESLPDWAVNGQDIDLIVQFPRDLSPEEVKAQLRIRMYEILEEVKGEPTLYLRAPIDKLYHLADLPFITWVEPIPAPGEPEDTGGRTLHRANMLSSLHPLGRDYDGSGINIMVRDDGGIGPHIDFENRFDQSFAPNLGGTHGDGVAGVMAGAGNLDPTVEGAASGSFIYVLNYQPAFTDQTLPLHQTDSVMITNSSYSNGCNAGYTTITQRVDQQMRLNHGLLHVFSAGNSNNQNCGYGAGNQWGNITGGHKQGKNVIATANLFADGALVNSSSRGPAHDGRVKPDISAHGQGQISTDPFNAYQSFGGTSAAAPSAAGVMAQLYQAYRVLNGNQYPDAGLIKAIVLNTAEDYGNPGPDYRFGWGLINGYRSVKVLETNQYFSDSIFLSGLNTHTLTVPAGVQEMRVMVYWTDLEGTVNASRALVNDLDIEVNDPSGTNHLPLVLDPTPNVTTLNAPAVPGVDTLNNVEQVRIVSPAAGSYTLTVTGTDIPLGSQEYWVVYDYWLDEITVTYPNGGEGFVPGETERLHWDAYGNTGNFTLEYSTDDGATWNPIATVPGSERMTTWTVPNTVSDSAKVRISRGTTVGESDYRFNIIEVPQNLNVAGVCSTSVQLVWDPVPGAAAYKIYILGNQYMDSLDMSTVNSACVPINSATQEHWFAVSALTANGGESRRSIAVEQNPGIVNCNADDLRSFSLLSPAQSLYSSCFADTLFVELNVLNTGFNAQNGFQVTYQLNADPPVSQTYNDTLQGCSSTTILFATPLTTLFPAINQLKVWTSLTGDQNPGNDTLTTFIQLTNQVFTLPLSEDFESFSSCGTSANCEAENCNLTNGWFNLENGVSDDIDWRVDAGGTPSPGTGPSIDHNPGTSTGQYLYLEGSGGCSNQEAIMLSSCIDLTNITIPELSFWYHMWGGDIASLHLDVFDGQTWQNDAMPPLLGDQGDQWQQAVVDLSAYAGSKIQIRFRGYTGANFEGDIAIDDINFLEANAPPLVNFSSDINALCTGQIVDFTDLSLLAPNSWSWSFSPNTVTFLNGTDSTTQSPTVRFDAGGSYTVSLTATNTVGSATDTQTAYIQVDNGLALPITEDFESFAPCGTASDCEDEVCILGNGWTNLVNGVEDDIDWRTDFGGTPSSGTGPGIDHNPGNAVGNYLYLEGSGGCNDEEAILVSPCIDLSGSTLPELRFWYHMFGGDIASLHVDVKSDTAWDLDVMPPLSGDQGDQWLQASVDLSTYAGGTIQIRFRGSTGDGFEGDMAIDDISLLDTNTPPFVAFNANATEICTGQVVDFSDISQLNPTAWSWSFSPNTVTYLSGTDSTTQSPRVQFNANGSYTVALTATNTVGASTETKTAFIQVSDGLVLPFSEDFESFGLCGTAANCATEICPLGNGWTNLINGFEDDIDWRVDEGGTPSNGTGPNVDHNPGTSTGNYLYLEGSGPTGNTCANQEAILLSPCINLVNETAPLFSFWYHMEGDDIDSLHVDVINGTSLDLDVMSPIAGEQGPNWQQAIVDLSAYSGSIIQVRLRGTTGDDFQGDIAIDDLIFVSTPVANFGFDGGQICEGTPITIADSSLNANAASYLWDFGPGASPATSTSAGSQNVVWNSPGNRTITLTLTNALSSSTYSQNITVNPLPTSDFSSNSSNGYKFNFTNFSANANSYLWDFGDGNTSTAILTSHTYGANGSFDITLIVSNGCGSDTLVQTVNVSNVVPPTAILSVADTSYCEGDLITFESQSFGIAISDYAWDFGDGADPDTANTAGPHTISYQTPGTKMVVHSVANGQGTAYDTVMIEIEPLPQAAFTDSLGNAQTYFFTNQSSDASAYNWDFGDGGTSASAEPVYTYLSNGLYTITLIATNECGRDTATSTADITNVSIEKELTGLTLKISPNPNGGQFSLWVNGQRQGLISLALLDIRGKAQQTLDFQFPGGEYEEEIDARGLAKGIYLLRISMEEETVYRRVVIR